MLVLSKMRIIIKPMVVVILGSGLVACSRPVADDGRPSVVVSTSILADVTRQIVGEGAAVETVIPPGVDPHDFAISSTQAGLIGGADLVIVNGLGLDAAVEEIARAATVPVLVVGPLVDPIPFATVGDDHATETLDPHFWQDPRRMMKAVDLIAETLLDRIPELDDDLIANRAMAYREQIEDLDRLIAARFDQIPVERRIMVTNHDSFGYLADRYDLTVIGVVIPGGSTLAQPGSAEVAGLIEQIERYRVRAIFADNVASSDVARAVAAELGAEIEVVMLVSDALGVEGAPDTYLGMMETNAEAIADSMR